MRVAPVQHKKMSAAIVRQMVEKIRNGELRPGDRLPPERQLAEDFHVSRATLREALSVMEIIGVVEMRVGEGSFITDMNIVPFVQMISRLFVRDEAMEKELLDLRKLLEIEAVRLILQRELPESELEALHALVNDMERSLFAQDVEKGVEADVGFHRMLFSLSNNYILQIAGECISLLMESSVRFNRGKILQDANNMEVLYNQHHIIYKALLQRDETMAVRMLTKHLDLVKQML